MSKYIKIVADYNDSDFLTELKKLKEEDLPLIKKVVSLLKEGRLSDDSYNWPAGENMEFCPEELYSEITEEEFEILYDYLPWTERGIHSIISVKILEVEQIDCLFGKDSQDTQTFQSNKAYSSPAVETALKVFGELSET